jgi:hypothetical protein
MDAVGISAEGLIKVGVGNFSAISIDPGSEEGKIKQEFESETKGRQ